MEDEIKKYIEDKIKEVSKFLECDENDIEVEQKKVDVYKVRIEKAKNRLKYLEAELEKRN